MSFSPEVLTLTQGYLSWSCHINHFLSVLLVRAGVFFHRCRLYRESLLNVLLEELPSNATTLNFINHLLTLTFSSESLQQSQSSELTTAFHKCTNYLALNTAIFSSQLFILNMKLAQLRFTSSAWQYTY